MGGDTVNSDGKFDDPTQDGFSAQDVAARMGEMEKVPLTDEVAVQLKTGIDTAKKRDCNLKQTFDIVMKILDTAAKFKPILLFCLCLPLMGCGISTEIVAAQKVEAAQMATVIRNADRERAGWALATKNAQENHVTDLYHIAWNKAVGPDGKIDAKLAQEIMTKWNAQKIDINAKVAAGVAKGQAYVSEPLKKMLDLHQYLVGAEEEMGKFDPSVFAQGMISIGQDGLAAYEAIAKPAPKGP
jgi:hypothetical protein